MYDILALVRQEALYMRQIRRSLHRMPELGNQEWETSATIKKELTSMGIEYEDCIANTGVIGYLYGKKPNGKVILIRADMDALPMEELNDCDFKSQNPGVMHACGHDTHISCLLGAAKVLSQMKNEYSGTIKLCFQPSEESSPSGVQAALMIPLMNPIADILDITRQVTVTAFNFGDGLSNMINPLDGCTIGALALAGISYKQWFKWCFPITLVLVVIGAIILYFLGMAGWTGL